MHVVHDLSWLEGDCELGITIVDQGSGENSHPNQISFFIIIKDLFISLLPCHVGRMLRIAKSLQQPS